MENRFDKTIKQVSAGYKPITQNSGKYREDEVFSIDKSYEGEFSGWQIRISIFPDEDNLQKAYNALSEYFQKNKQIPAIDVKCLLLPQSDKNCKHIIDDWDPLHLTGYDRSQRGREVCIYIGLKGKNKDDVRRFIKQPSEWKALMLDLWKTLQDADVAMGYTPTPSGDKTIPSEIGLLVPFSYTSFKPFNERHGILKQENYNPMAFDDPLDGMTEITWDDLSKAKISHETVDKQMTKRITDAITHLNNMEFVIHTKLATIMHMTSYNEDFAPIDSNKKVVDRSASEQLTGEHAIDEILKIKEDFKEAVVTKYISRLSHVGIDIDKCIDNAPSEMQKIYRGIIHASHEKLAHEKDIKHHDIQGVKPAQRTNETLKDLAIALGLFLGFIATGAGIGALIGTFAFPLVGTAVGAAIGAFFGGAIGVFITGFQALVRKRLFGGNYVSAEMTVSSILTALSVAGLGALIGTFLFPVIGTIIGAEVGFCVGACVSTFTFIFSVLDTEDTPTQMNDQDVEDIGNVPDSNNLYNNPFLQSINCSVNIIENLTAFKFQKLEKVKPVKQHDIDISITLLDGNVITFEADLRWTVEELKENLLEEMRKEYTDIPESNQITLLYNDLTLENDDILNRWILVKDPQLYQQSTENHHQLKAGL